MPRAIVSDDGLTEREERMGSPSIEVAPVASEAQLLQALAVRAVVFIEGQGVPEALERDSEDATAFHVVASLNKHAIATGRLVLSQQPPGESGTWGRIGRMAVLSAHRKLGVGKLVLAALEDEARRRKYAGVHMHAQVSAQDFYVRHGYRTHGAVFEEAAIQHVEMLKKL